MVPLQLAAVVLESIELLHLRDVVLQLHGKCHRHSVCASRPRRCVQDLYVDGIYKRSQHYRSNLPSGMGAISFQIWNIHTLNSNADFFI